MTTAEIIDIAGGQAVKLPAEFHFDGAIVSIRREGNAVILEPVDMPNWCRQRGPKVSLSPFVLMIQDLFGPIRAKCRWLLNLIEYFRR